MQVGAIYIWTYVYIIMRIYSDKSAEDTDTNQPISDSESYKALLLSRKNSGSSGCSKEDELPLTISGEKVRFPWPYFIITNASICFFLMQNVALPLQILDGVTLLIKFF
jgi:hypothetical protein